jgi:hypothetical protein
MLTSSNFLKKSETRNGHFTRKPTRVSTRISDVICEGECRHMSIAVNIVSNKLVLRKPVPTG